MIKTRSDAAQVWVVNPSAAGAASGSTSIVNSAGWVVNICNSAGWIVSIANTVAGGDIVQISNSAGWVVNVANTSPLVQIQNSAGWIVNVANTGGSVVVSNTQTAINIINSAGWIVAVSNTGGASAITNSAGWIVYNVESGFPVVIVTTVVSTIGLVTILTNNVLRRGASIYNFSTQPFYFKLGASADTTSYTLMMVSSGYYELPKPVYTGIISGLWGSANGYALISELTG